MKDFTVGKKTRKYTEHSSLLKMDVGIYINATSEEGALDGALDP